LTEFFAEVLGTNARTVLVARLIQMVTRSIIKNVVGRGVLLELDFTTMHGPEPMLLLLARRSESGGDNCVCNQFSNYNLGDNTIL
jgi:hypothetical protein